MVELTQGSQLTFYLVYGTIGFLMTVYSIYLNWKQAKVEDLSVKLLTEVIEIKELLKEKL